MALKLLAVVQKHGLGVLAWIFYGSSALLNSLTQAFWGHSPDAPRVLLGTGKLVGEGFDHPPLDTLVLAMPVS